MPSPRFSLVLLLVSFALTLSFVAAQGPPHMRRHTANKAQALRLVPATQSPPATSHHSIETIGESRQLAANGIPEHRVGEFPNRGNPHSITTQRYHFQLPANPQIADSITPLHTSAGRQGPPNRPFGIALNGVLLDPGTAEFWMGDRFADWNYEALGGAVGLGLDANHAHVQPNGAYHYHGLPMPYLQDLGLDKTKHSPPIGWAGARCKTFAMTSPIPFYS